MVNDTTCTIEGHVVISLAAIDSLKKNVSLLINTMPVAGLAKFGALSSVFLIFWSNMVGRNHKPGGGGGGGYFDMFECAVEYINYPQWYTDD